MFVAESDPPVFPEEPTAVGPAVAAVTMPFGSVVPTPVVNFVLRIRPSRCANFWAR